MNIIIDAIAIAGLFLIVWAIIGPPDRPGARAAGAATGIVALLLAAILQSGREDRHPWES
jgi:hypothetical protein